jgi:AraC-like DNA-binding protein
MAFTQFISVISLAVLIFLAVLLAVDRQRPPGARYLLVFLLILGSFIALRLAADLQSLLLLYLPFAVFPAAFFYGSCIFLYSETALFNRHKPVLFWVGLLFLPALVLVIHGILHWRFSEMRDVASIVMQAGIIAPYSRILIGVAVLYSLIFLLLTRRNLQVYQASYQENFAGNDQDQLRWLKLFVTLNLILVASFFCVIIVIAVFDIKVLQTPVEGIIALIMLYIVLYYFVKKPAIFTLPTAVQAEVKNKSGVTKYQKQNLAEGERKAYLEKIEKYLTDEKPFLDDKVTLAALSRELGIPSHHFSMVINIERNTNFYHFINAYRVDEAKALLTRADMHDETVLDIGLMAGFQSKAGFNKVFKEITGLTPSEFREKSKTA